MFILSILTIFLFNCYLSSDQTIVQSIVNILKLFIKYLNEIIHYLEEKTIEGDSKDIQEDFIEKKEEEQCVDHRYKIRLIERSPLIIYIENFLQKSEIDHLIELGSVKEKTLICI